MNTAGMDLWFCKVCQKQLVFVVGRACKIAYLVPLHHSLKGLVNSIAHITNNSGNISCIFIIQCNSFLLDKRFIFALSLPICCFASLKYW